VSLKDAHVLRPVWYKKGLAEAGAYQGKLLLSSSVNPLVFTVSYPMPPAEINYLEGRVEGGDSIVITV
jgi:hypothetical protein